MDIALPHGTNGETRDFAGGRLDNHHARLGTRIGDRFLLEDVLDHVPFGSAYRAIDTHAPADAPERRVMLWLLPPHAGQGIAAEALRTAFVRVRALQHPCIGRVYQLGRADNAYFITAELVDGETLRNVLDHLRPERLDEAEAAAIARAVGAALAHAHDAEILHGEVRAENVVVTMSHEAKLVNFMASRLVRLEPSAARATGDVRDFAALVHELYTGDRLGARDRAQTKAPKRVARAIEAALHSGRHGLTIREFLAAAGLTPDAPRDLAPEAPPLPAALPAHAAPVRDVALDRIAPVELAPAKRATRRSVWRFAMPFMALAAVAVALHATGNVDTLLAAGRQLQSAGETLLSRGVGGTTAAPERALEAAAIPTPPAFAAVVAPGGAPPPTPSPPPKPEAPVLSFAAAKISAREGQSMVTLDIVRTSGDGPASVVWWTTDDTAHAREDYASFGKRVERFGAADNGRRIIIPIVSDSLREASEHFQVHIAARSDGTRIGAIDTVDVTLLDDDDS